MSELASFLQTCTTDAIERLVDIRASDEGSRVVREAALIERLRRALLAEPGAEQPDVVNAAAAGAHELLHPPAENG